ncbi:MAG: hypothetical protein RJA07_1419 [Bacteroidota bacterium]|jgi:hypothetical protein
MKSLFTAINRNKINYILFAFLLIMLVLEIINQRFWLNDFKVYFNAADNFKNGKPIYGQLFSLGSGFYKYSPFAALIFIPFTYVSYFIAEIFFYLISSVAIFYVFNSTLNWIKKSNDLLSTKNIFYISLFSFLVVAVHLQRELHLGNVNMILLALLIFAWHKIECRNFMLAGFVLAFVILFKPHFVILLPLLLLRKEWKILSWLLIASVLFLAISFIYTGFGNGLQLMIDWKNTMLLHNEATSGNEQTIYFMAYHYLLRYFNIDSSIYVNAALIMLCGIFIFAFVLFHFKNEKQNQQTTFRNYFFEYFLLIGLVPCVTVTDTEHFLYSVPVILCLISFLYQHKLPIIFLIATSFLLILFGIKVTGVIGNYWADVYLEHGLLGISNLMLLFAFVGFSMLKAKMKN